MIYNDLHDTCVRIDLSAGMYVFRPISATGKSYFGLLLRKLQELGQNVRYYTYIDWVNKSPLAEIPYDVIFFDRVDMYPEILDICHNSGHVVLLDYKQGYKLAVPSVQIELKAQEVRIWK